MSKNSGVALDWFADHNDGKTGKLVCRSIKRKKWGSYFFGEWDIKRVYYCEHNRNAHIPDSYREGRLNLVSLMFTIYVWIRRRNHGM